MKNALARIRKCYSLFYYYCVMRITFLMHMHSLDTLAIRSSMAF